MDVRGPNKLDMDVPRPPMQPRAPGPGGLRPQEEDRRPAQAPQPRPQAKMVPKAPENIVCPGLRWFESRTRPGPPEGRIGQLWVVLWAALAIESSKSAQEEPALHARHCARALGTINNLSI